MFTLFVLPARKTMVCNTLPVNVTAFTKACRYHRQVIGHNLHDQRDLFQENVMSVISRVIVGSINAPNRISEEKRVLLFVFFIFGVL